MTGSVDSAKRPPPQMHTTDSHLGNRHPCATGQASGPLPEEFALGTMLHGELITPLDEDGGSAEVT